MIPPDGTEAERARDLARVASWFWTRVEPEPNSGCWLWIGDLSPNNYGRVEIGTRSRRAHLVAYELLIGVPPADLDADHICRVRPCVNPWHLEFVTNKVNILRGVSFSAVNARKTACPRGHEFTPDNTMIVRRANGTTYRQCLTCETKRRGMWRAIAMSHRQQESSLVRAM